MKHYRLIFVVLIAVLLFSCVPARQFEDVKAQKTQCEGERLKLKRSNETLSAANNELNAEVAKLKRDKSYLVNDTLLRANAYSTLTAQYDKINELYNKLLDNQAKLQQDADADAQRAMSLLQTTRDELQRREDELRALEARLNRERSGLDSMQMAINLKENELHAKDATVKALEAQLRAQDSIMNALRNKVAEALTGFEGKGLTVSMKDGKVYVSLEEKLLFKSGKWNVDPKGEQALSQLAKVLETNPDINIMIEGHTDDLAYNGNNYIADNWDLSTKRATTIVKILLDKSNIDPTRLVAAGRGQFLPIDDSKTTEARAKNRRTEIILTPKLDILYDVMNKK